MQIKTKTQQSSPIPSTARELLLSPKPQHPTHLLAAFPFYLSGHDEIGRTLDWNKRVTSLGAAGPSQGHLHLRRDRVLLRVPLSMPTSGMVMPQTMFALPSDPKPRTNGCLAIQKAEGLLIIVQVIALAS